MFDSGGRESSSVVTLVYSLQDPFHQLPDLGERIQIEGLVYCMRVWEVGTDTDHVKLRIELGKGSAFKAGMDIQSILQYNFSQICGIVYAAFNIKKEETQ